MKRIVFLSVLFILLFQTAFGQDDASLPKTAKNVIHGNFGIIGYNINYERTFYEGPKSHFNFRGGLGWVQDFYDEENTNLLASIQYITGYRWFHFEAGLGLNVMSREEFEIIDYRRYMKITVLPLVMVGIRIEGPGRGPVFRMGLGTEGAIMSIGLGWKF